MCNVHQGLKSIQHMREMYYLAVLIKITFFKIVSITKSKKIPIVIIQKKANPENFSIFTDNDLWPTLKSPSFKSWISTHTNTHIYLYTTGPTERCLSPWYYLSIYLKYIIRGGKYYNLPMIIMENLEKLKMCIL